MGKTLSMDLRSRAIGAVEGGMSCRDAADHFGVAPSTVIRWRSAQMVTGSYEPHIRGRKLGTYLDRHADLVVEVYEANRDATLAEMCALLADRGIITTKSSLEQAISAGRMVVKYDRQIQFLFDGLINGKELMEKMLEEARELTYATPEAGGLKFNFAKAVGFEPSADKISIGLAPNIVTGALNEYLRKLKKKSRSDSSAKQ